MSDERGWEELDVLLLVGRECNGCFGGRRLYDVCDEDWGGPVQVSICKSTLCSVLNCLLQIGQRIPGSRVGSFTGTSSTTFWEILSCTCSPDRIDFSELVPTSFFVARSSNFGLQHQCKSSIIIKETLTLQTWNSPPVRRQSYSVLSRYH